MEYFYLIQKEQVLGLRLELGQQWMPEIISPKDVEFLNENSGYSFRNSIGMDRDQLINLANEKRLVAIQQDLAEDYFPDSTPNILWSNPLPKTKIANALGISTKTLNQGVDNGEYELRKKTRQSWYFRYDKLGLHPDQVKLLTT
ncbi:MAG: hypothetical protein GY869_28670 [Planctomycetes bacterium]|nr:hypothetical protein [Planctomycetota bacterium]